jgi:hypothetical protein
MAISVLDPQQQALGVPPWPLTPAGQVLGEIETFTRVPDTVRPAAGVSLGPGKVMRIGIPLRLSGTCYDPAGWEEIPDFYVEVRYLTFTQWVAVPYGIPLLMHAPYYPGQIPAKDVTCLAKH